MDDIILSLAFLLAVVISTWLARATRLPIPLVQIGLGALIVWVTGTTVDLKPDIFFLLFLPPLLFLEGWRIPKTGLFRDWRPILQLSIGLVVFTVLGGGLIIHILIPDMPLSVAFALAAVLSPTDPVALSSITTRIPMPARLKHILEGESLLNDASGLVCLRLAVAVALTGTFSLVHAGLLFLWLALAGIACGVAVAWLANMTKSLLTRYLGEEPGSQILVSLLIPFGAYMLAEYLHCSGILAAVAAGITMSYAEQKGTALPETRIQRTAVWDMIAFATNGIIFVLLGEQFPTIAARAEHVVVVTGHHDPIWMLFYILAINVVLAALRFFWVWLSFQLNFSRRRGAEGYALRTNWRLIAITSVAGVRGALTLAGVLTIPLYLNDGNAFPARNLVIFLAAGVIITSLLIATILLPLLLSGLPQPEDESLQERIEDAKRTAASAAIKAIEALSSGVNTHEAEIYAQAGNRAIRFYTDRLSAHDDSHSRQHLIHLETVERAVWEAALHAERNAYLQQDWSGNLPDDVVRELVKDVDFLETRLQTLS